jgi:hypothetical protein
MGEIQNRPFQLSFNASLKVEFQGSRVTSDGGLILVRELDERLGFGELIAQHLTDCASSTLTVCLSKGGNPRTTPSFPLEVVSADSVARFMAGFSASSRSRCPKLC